MQTNVDKKLTGSMSGAVIAELFSNTIHFPIANIILELLRTGVSEYMLELDMYVIIFCCLVQGYFLGRWNFEKRKLQLLGNMIGPVLYMTIEVLLEGLEFFDSYNHIAYLIFGFTVGGLQQIQAYIGVKRGELFIVLENMVRTYIVLVMYIIYEMTLPEAPVWAEFIKDDSHIYFATVITLLGLVIGFSNVTSMRYLGMLKDTAKMMKTFSEWFLGGKILSEALDNKETLKLKKERRTIIFADIRGFTAWSEKHTPEEVVGMLNNFFEISEKCFCDENIIKVKYTGDEIMAVCRDNVIAISDAIKAAGIFEEYLSEYGLKAGIGVHAGYLVEGVMGGSQIKAYDVIGDTVNTAKRICDNAGGNEVLLSEEAIKDSEIDLDVISRIDITAKGKSNVISVVRIK